MYYHQYAKTLLKKHMEGTASPDEVEKLLAILDVYDEEEIIEMIDQTDPEINFDKYVEGPSTPPSPKELKYHINKNQVYALKSRFNDLGFRAAVFIGLAITTFIALWFNSRPSQLEYYCGKLPGDSESPTGIYSCRLLLANGCRVLIDSAYRGRVTSQGDMDIIKLKPGILEYRKSSRPLTAGSTSQLFNTITTAEGQQYRVLLSDGTKVRLNAGSSIRFPVDLAKIGRSVEVQGEAFFEVAPDKDHPFLVKVKNTEIRALGTSFNVNAYTSDIITTLVSGHIEIIYDTFNVRLKTGQQAIIRHEPTAFSERDSIFTVNKGDIPAAISWTKVRRNYSHIKMKDFVTEIARSYDLKLVNIHYVPDRIISASLCYDTPLEEILKIFRSMGLVFIKDGNRIIFCNRDR